jgi:7-cyano-7-deazaguanine synthase in queuosine biosynthesis
MGPELVALFSGGVDSLTSAFELLSSGTPTALASYFGDGPTGGLQRTLVAHLENRYGVELPTYRFRLSEAGGVGPLGARWPGFVDRTTRSRSFLFLALGVLIADMYGVEVVRMAENGLIAVNVPLHGGRAGSLSTRTAHPYFVERFNNLLSDSGIGIVIDNPFLLLTKGDVSERLVAMADRALIGKTISCAHPIGRWQREGYRNCGYCFPCLIRRAGFHKTGSDPTHYSVNPMADAGFYSDRPAAASDIRSVARSLLDPVRAGDILATGPIATFELLTDLHEMRQRGVKELRSLLIDLSTRRVRKLLGL